MKFNQWTAGLAAVGAISLASVAQADEKASPTVLTALSSTTLSGYVDTSAQWNLGTGDTHAPDYRFGGLRKADGFNLDVVKLTLEKPLDESEWAAGYKVDLLFGPDANAFPIGLGTQSTSTTPNGISADFGIKQAYVALRTPIGNGIDWKIGVFDSIIGYESFEAGNNPNFTRSWGFTIEPTTHTGLLGTYRVNNNIAIAAGIANTVNPQINSRAFSNPIGATGPKAESYKSYMASIALTAPDNWGFLSGSSLYAGVVNGFNGNAGIGANQVNFYVGSTIATPVTGLRVGVAYDYLGIPSQGNVAAGSGFLNKSAFANAVSGYGSYQATEKLSFHGRIEYASFSQIITSLGQTGFPIAGGGVPGSVMSLTGTVQYDLWKNVISRLELRWDHELDGALDFGGTGLPRVSSTGRVSTGTRNNSYIVAANIIYKF